MALRKISAHLMEFDDISVIHRLRPSVAKVVESKGLLAKLIPGLPPETKFIQRIYASPSQFSYPDPNYAARMFLDTYHAQYIAPLLPFTESRWIALEGFNETQVDGWICDFSAYLTELLAERYGLKHVALNWATGNYNEQKAWRPVIGSGLPDVLVEHDGRIGLHGYGNPTIFTGHGDGSGQILHYEGQLLNTWHAFGVMRAKYWLDQAGFKDTRFILTEFGLDKGGKETDGWQSITNAAEYTKQLLYAEKQLQALPFVDGACIYSLNGAGVGWQSFNIAGSLIKKLLASMGDAPMGCTVTLKEGATALNIRPQPNIDHAPIGVLRAGETATAAEKRRDTADPRRYWYYLPDRGGWCAGWYLAFSGCGDIPDTTPEESGNIQKRLDAALAENERLAAIIEAVRQAISI